MRKLLVIFTLLAGLLFPTQVHAQSVVGFESLNVSLWPEYDTPTALVIYRIKLSQQTALPAQVTLRLPATVKKLAVVAVGDTADSVSDSNITYTFTPGTDYANITIEASKKCIQIEYYDPALVKNGNQRNYTLEWGGEYSVDTFHLDLRQPLQATGFTSEPALTNTVLDTEGFQLSEYNQTNLQAGQKLTFNMSYKRETDSPSTSFLQVQPSAPLDQNVPGQTSWTTYLPWILGGVGLALLLIAGGVYWTSNRAARSAIGRKRHSNHSADAGGSQVYCSQCGKRAQSNDRFCRACGARIQKREG